MEKPTVGGGGEAKSSATTTATSTAEAREERNPNSDQSVEASVEQEQEPGSNGVPSRQSSRTPFTNLSQVDADLALARTLQEQERAYMMLRMNGEGSDYGSWETGSYAHEDEDDFGEPNDGTDADDNEDGYDGTDEDNDDEDVFDVHAHADAGEDASLTVEFDPSAISSDEAYARALQDAEDREMAARLLAFARINDREVDDIEDHGGHSQDVWEEVDPDELSYEELLALSEVVGTENRGLSADRIASLPSVNYKTQSNQDGINDSCVICRLDYEEGDTLTVLSCKHSYHADCLNNWLQINKVCPVCNTEVSTSENRF
ncbi:E3 ubiquitin ligase BIG BROTHER-related [Malania oleifera]|uniref:E3 ubiquitin ligase BIG BROTHER-related n=1 Tax=Malania oleifera TaxID=397392 RepID=UPI0025AE8208|nr:E3 ubiquitin ligase BIG BROTHER-related [Malania oleifera]